MTGTVWGAPRWVPVSVAIGVIVGAGAAVALYLFPRPGLAQVLGASAVVVGAVPLLATLRGFLRTRTLATLLPAAFFAMCLVTVTFNGLRVVSFADYSDVFLAGAVITGLLPVLFQRVRPRVPPWVWVGSGVVLFSALVSTLRAGSDPTNYIGALEFVLGVNGLALVASVVATSRDQVQLAVRLWMFSAIINGAVALADAYGLSHISEDATGLFFLGRVMGFTVHPTHLGLVMAMAIPPLLVIAIRPQFRFDRIVGLVGLVVVGDALLFSGSRAALVAAIAGAGIIVAIAPQVSPWVRLGLGFVGAAAVGIVLVTTFNDPTGLPAIDRLFGTSTVNASDIAHQLAGDEAIANIETNPFLGIGFDVARDAHDIYLQLLEAGGVLALIGFLIYALGVGWNGIRLAWDRTFGPSNQLMSAALSASVLVWLIEGYAQNPLYDRFLLVPGALLAAFWLIRRLGPSDAADALGHGPVTLRARQQPQGYPTN